MTAATLSADNLDTSRSEIRGIQTRTWAGLDLGQKQDFTRLAVIESHEITYVNRNPATYEFLNSNKWWFTIAFVSAGNLFAGTSGFAYPTWKPGFYPQDLPAKKFLTHYASRLNSTEINYTYHRLPTPKSLQEWVDHTPPEFLFSLKAHMKITHVLRLKDCGSFLELFFRAIDPLRVVGRLGPVLFQLPPNMKCDIDLLTDFTALLPSDLRFAFEFRHDSWLAAPVYDLMSARGLCLCLAESEKLVVPHVLTAPFVYFRLRKGEYSPEERGEIADRVRGLLEGGRDVYAYFKHEDSPAGALYAEELFQAFQR